VVESRIQGLRKASLDDTVEVEEDWAKETTREDACQGTCNW